MGIAPGMTPMVGSPASGNLVRLIEQNNFDFGRDIFEADYR